MVLYGLVRQMPIYIYTSWALEGSHREHPYIRRYAPSSRFRFSRRDRNAYIPPRKGERERARARTEGSTQGEVYRIDSANLHVCARARARSADTCVHTRLVSSCARRHVQASIKAVRCLPRRGRRDSNLLGPLPFPPPPPPPAFSSSSSSFFLDICTPPASHHLSLPLRSHARISFMINARYASLRLPTFMRSLVLVGPSRFYLRVPRPKRLLYIRNRPTPNFVLASNFDSTYTPGCCLRGFPMNVC